MDNQYTKDGITFVERCCAIIYNKDRTKVLLFQYQGRDYYLLPGGRVCLLEDSFTAIKREIEEELNLKLDFKLSAIGENILYDKQICGIDFYYKTTVEEFNEEEFISPIENDEQIYRWVLVNEIDNYNIKPNRIKQIIKDENEELIHFIEKVN